jgi:hypothetical protein
VVRGGGTRDFVMIAFAPVSRQGLDFDLMSFSRVRVVARLQGIVVDLLRIAAVAGCGCSSWACARGCVVHWVYYLGKTTVYKDELEV